MLFSSRQIREIEIQDFDRSCSAAMLAVMTRDIYKKLGLAAVILLAPGGFILGAGLAANHYRKKRMHDGSAAASQTPADADT